MKVSQLTTFIAIGGVVLIGLGFAGGFETEKLLAKPTPTAQVSGTTSGQDGGGQRRGFGGQGRFGGQRPTTGTVTAVNGDVLTVNDMRSGSTITVELTASTKITSGDGTTAAAASDITTGTTILAFGTTSGSTLTATSIRLNPSFGAAPSGAAGGSSGI